jgi:hypothetical protein
MRKPSVLIVTGTCGVGKSSVSRLWAGRRKGAVIHCDQMREWLPCDLRRADRYQEALLVRLALKTAGEFMGMGLDVAIDNVWTPVGMALIHETLAPTTNLRAVYLRCDLTENARRDKLRSSSDVMGGRVAELDAELQTMAWPSCVVKLNSTSQTAEETAAAVEALFQS